MDTNTLSDALENARTACARGDARLGRPLPRHQTENIERLLLAVLRELPEDLTVLELRQSLEDL